MYNYLIFKISNLIYLKIISKKFNNTVKSKTLLQK